MSAMTSLACRLRAPISSICAVSASLFGRAPICAAVRRESSSIQVAGDTGVRRNFNPECYVCGEVGHFARNCSKLPPPSGMSKTDTREAHRQCERCLERGHDALNCLNDPHPKSVLVCPKCGDRGHMKHQCLEIFANSSPGSCGINLLRCPLCGLPGHWKEDCTHRKTTLPWQ